MTLVHDGTGLRVSVFTGGPFQQNTWLLECTRTGAAVLVDPGAATPAAVAKLEAEGRAPGAAWLTHAHLDHVDGLPELARRFPGIPVALHPADQVLYDRAADQARAFGIPFGGELPRPSVTLAAGDTLQVGDCGLEVRFTPGHAPGHVILVAKEEGVALVGDVVFQRSIGRTDLPGGDFQRLMRSIQEEVLTLPDETRLLPGHGPPTTVGEERMGNPFLLPATGGPGNRLA